MSVVKVGIEDYVTVVDARSKPAAVANPGDTIILEAKDCYHNRLVNENSRRKTDMVGCETNPVAGPVYIQGAEPGDTLKIDILDIEITSDMATMELDPETVPLVYQKFMPEIRTLKIPLKDGYADIFGLQAEMNPMLGYVAVAPSQPMGPLWPGPHGGNMDCKLITKGTSLYLPVQVEGALLTAGDIHARQADGELICGLEVPGIITLKVELIKGKAEPWPVLETEDRWNIIVSMNSLEQSCAVAIDSAVKFALKRSDQYDSTQWSVIVCMFGDLEICEVYDPIPAVRYAIHKDALKGIAF